MAEGRRKSFPPTELLKSGLEYPRTRTCNANGRSLAYLNKVRTLRVRILRYANDSNDRCIKRAGYGGHWHISISRWPRCVIVIAVVDIFWADQQKKQKQKMAEKEFCCSINRLAYCVPCDNRQLANFNYCGMPARVRSRVRG